ncbi:DUF349 domain-containing protein [Paludibacter sp.]
MDSIENNKEVEITNTELNQENEAIDLAKTEEVTVQDDTVATVDTTETDVVDTETVSRQGLVDLLKQLLEKTEIESREKIDNIKHNFYKLLKAEREEEKKKLASEGADASAYEPLKDELEEEFKNLMNEYKNKRAVLYAKIEAEKENNLLQKQHIIERMKVLVDNNEDVSSHINEFRELQKKWKSIGQVPQENMNELWKAYSSCQEAFWDLIKINNELRDYDFKKNLEMKTAICETAERLGSESDVVSAFRLLQQLHEEWREIGPVAREFRDEIWNRFKAASEVVNRQHQGHFEDIKKIENDNFNAKTVLCEKIEAFDIATLSTYKDWEKATKTIIMWQEEWRAIGFAPRKLNQKLFDRYRTACDAFFNAKSEFYKESRGALSENLEKKKALCEKAESLKDSTDWKGTSNIMIKMQKEWKTIGAVPRKYSDEIWKRFISACDYFFEQKQKSSEGQKTEEVENLAKKVELIKKINELDIEADKNPTEVLASLRGFIAEWNEIGFVPFKEKDRIYKEYRAAVDKMFEKLNVDSNQRRLDTFKSNLKDMSTKGENKLLREREKLMRAYEHLKSEISTYENNIGFLSSTNKKGGGLIKDLERKIDTLKEEARLIEQKVELIEKSIKAE